MDVSPEPFPGYDAEIAKRFAMTCLQCAYPAPCMVACPHNANVPGMLRWVTAVGCSSGTLQTWVAAQEQVAVAQVEEQICAAYN